MAIIAKASSNGSGGDAFVPTPAGMHRAICCDVIDLGMVTTQWGTKHKVKIVWQTEAAMPDGKPFLVGQRYTLSLDPKSNLRRDLEMWRARPFSEQEAMGFDLERLIGVACTLMVVHNPGRDPSKVFADVKAVLPAQSGVPLAIRAYVRHALRPATTTPAPTTSAAAAPATYAPTGWASPPQTHDPFGGVPHPALTDEPPF